ALERGDVKGLAKALHYAERDSQLEYLIMEANETYLEETSNRTASADVADGRPTEALAGREDGRRPITSRPDLLPGGRRQPARSPQWLRYLQSAAAVMVVIAVLGGFTALFALRHSGPSSKPTQLPSVPAIVTGGLQGNVTALQPGTGKLIWSYQTSN